MANITIRNLDETVKVRLRVRAARHGRSMEEEVREILRTALAEGGHRSQNLVEVVRRRFAEVGGVELDIPARESIRKPPRLDR